MAPFKIPAEIIQKVLEYVADFEDVDSRYVLPLPTVRPISRSARPDLASARLVNRTFHDCATPLLFREIHAYFRESKYTNAPRDWALRLLHISGSPLANHVEVLRVGFYPRSQPSQDHLEEYSLEAAFVIPSLVQACQKLRVLDMRGPSNLRSTPGEIFHRIFMKTVDQVFRIIRQKPDNTPFDTIEMSLPSTHDYMELTSKPSKLSSDMVGRSFPPLMRSIRHLDIQVSDVTGLGGRRYYHEPASEGQRKYPNQTHQQIFWDLIQSATNLRSLCIRCSHVLNFDLLPIDGLARLCELKLSRVQMSTNHLLKLANSNASTLRAVELQCVQLDSGLWEAVLLHLCSVPGLDHFHIDSCGYTSTGDSRRHAWEMLPAIDDPKDIESCRTGDHYALGHLQRHVNAIRKRKSLLLYSSYDYNAAEYPTLEELYLE